MYSLIEKADGFEFLKKILSRLDNKNSNFEIISWIFDF